MKNLDEMKCGEIFTFELTNEVASSPVTCDYKCIEMVHTSPECALNLIDCDNKVLDKSGKYENVISADYLIGFSVQVTNGVILSEVEFNTIITHLMSIFRNNEKLESFKFGSLVIEFKLFEPDQIEYEVQTLEENDESDFVKYIKYYALISRFGA